MKLHEDMNFRIEFTTDKSAEQVFRAVQDVRNWWTGYYAEEFTGQSAKLDDEFTFTAGPGVHMSKHRLIELIPNKKIVWLTLESHLSFLSKADEWNGTKVIFDISEKNGKTTLIFTHEGLNPEVECYEACAPAWTQYLQNKLLPLINSGVAAKI